ncbi:hypothetical protein A33Q_1550 [Indibacter alkaliphilus LW1]|uniref:Uncharacterized protein n=1 Tax=Indibacter alkaliphilus (strain CCUG 57479 / KCTC 22604 / LW1) TaxID=1189612 RepID=S2E703_INDAL|nr:hypothetical protein A33Q_1550 [Indibacter alkaliphilus LW1]
MFIYILPPYFVSFILSGFSLVSKTLAISTRLNSLLIQ